MKKRINLHIIAAFLLLVALMSVLLGGVGSAYAAENKYSNVLDDLRKDESFDFNEYPTFAGDYSLQVIQIAESTDGELFLYVYQPSAHTKKLTATSVNMSLSESVDDTALFNLTLLNQEGVLQKYRVDGVKVSSDEVRYYNITSIYRNYDSDIDKSTGNDNTQNSVAYSVGRLYRVETIDGVLSYSCGEENIIEIVNPYVDFLEYDDGLFAFNGYCRGHYVAFTTDKQIDSLVEADVYYVSRTFSRKYLTAPAGYEKYTYTYNNDECDNIVHLNGEQTGGNSPGWFGHKYEWERIQSVDDFINTEKLSDTTKSNLKGKQWVLRFVETKLTVHESTSAMLNNVDWGTDISDVRILRLKYMFAGETYNVGAVSGGFTGDDMPGNPGASDKDDYDAFLKWLEKVTGVSAKVWKIVFTVLPIVIVLAIILPVLSTVFPAFGQVMLWIVKGVGFVLKYLAIGLWYVISAPFRLIALIVHKIRGD